MHNRLCFVGKYTKKNITFASDMAEKVNIFSISEKTGYSVSTVSRVLSGKAERYRISKKAVDLITQEANRCNYRPNMAAQTLRTQKSQTVGLLVPGIDNPFFATLAATVIQMLEARGYHTLLADSQESPREEEQALQMFRSRSVDGIICVPVATTPALHEQVSRIIPMVLIDRYFEQTSLPYVCTDNHAGASIAAQYLLEKGYSRILAIQGVPTSMPNRERVRGFLDALQDQPVCTAIAGDAFSVENGYRETLAAFPPVSGNAADRPYDAIFAFSSTILLGVIQALRELHLQVGKDVGVISYDNNGFLDFLDPAVTRVEQHVKEIGQMAVDILFKIMDARQAGLPEPAAEHRLIAPTLIVRASC